MKFSSDKYVVELRLAGTLTSTDGSAWQGPNSRQFARWVRTAHGLRETYSPDPMRSALELAIEEMGGGEILERREARPSRAKNRIY